MLLTAGCAAVEFKTEDSVMKGYFRVKDANSVAFYSSADGYTRNMAVKDGKRWTVTIPRTDEFTFYLETDGEIYVPECEMTQQDDFGGTVCVYQED